MKTLRELKEEGLISAPLYRCIIRGVKYDGTWMKTNRFGMKDYMTTDELLDLTPADILDLYDEEYMLRTWRLFGPKKLEELKSLI